MIFFGCQDHSFTLTLTLVTVSDGLCQMRTEQVLMLHDTVRHTVICHMVCLFPEQLIENVVVM